MNRRLVLTAAAAAAAAGIWALVHWWDILFGAGTWGAGGNMVAWVICGALGGVWLRAKLRAHQLAQTAQAERHHLEKMAQAERHHLEALQLARDHHKALKAHVTAVMGGEA